MHRKTIEPAGIVVPCSSIGASAVRGMIGMLGSIRMVSSVALATRTSAPCRPPDCDQSAAGYLTTGRIVTGDKQIRDHGHGFGVVQTLPVRLGSAQSGDEIV